MNDWLGESSDFSWALITGPGGAGKSRLAFQLCQSASDRRWHAGFITRGSSITNADKFERFRPLKPTLIVFDYVWEEAQKVGEIVRTLIDLSISKKLEHTVRFLLLERGASNQTWWPKFIGSHMEVMQKYWANRTSLNLDIAGLSDKELFELFSFALNTEKNVDILSIVKYLKEIDPQGLPLFAWIAVDAIKNGREIRQFDKEALLNDILSRDKRIWSALEENELNLTRHENLAALATMVGGVNLPDETKGFSAEIFPLDEKFHPELIGMISGGTEIKDYVPAIMPDVLGEWFVLQILKGQHVFDQRRPKELLDAADLRSNLCQTDASNFGSFRARAAEDFPEEVRQTELLRPPSQSASVHAAISWSRCMTAVFNAPDSTFVDADRVITAARGLRLVYQDNDDLFISTNEMYCAHAHMVLELGNIDAAFRWFKTLYKEAHNRRELPSLGWNASVLGRNIGVYCLGCGMLPTAEHLLEILREHAYIFQFVENAEKEEIADDAAYLGLSLRQYHIDNRNKKEVHLMNDILWAQQPDDQIDLAGRSGQMLMEFDNAGLLGGRESAYIELTKRSHQRPDVKEIAFWTANVSYGLVHNARDRRQFVDRIIDLACWLEAHIDWPDMADVHYDAVAHEWLTKEFKLGKAAVEALYDLWNDAVQAALKRGGEVKMDNSAVSLGGELEHALIVHNESSWAHRMIKEFRHLQKAGH